MALDPKAISKLLSEDVHTNNGFLFEDEATDSAEAAQRRAKADAYLATRPSGKKTGSSSDLIDHVPPSLTRSTPEMDSGEQGVETHQGGETYETADAFGQQLAAMTARGEPIPLWSLQRDVQNYAYGEDFASALSKRGYSYRVVPFQGSEGVILTSHSGYRGDHTWRDNQI